MNKENFRILIVDDEESFLLLMTRILKDEGYTVKGLTDPAGALKALGSFSPAMIISDLKMPGMDGIRFMQEAKKGSDADFIMITAFATVESAVEAMKMGASDYITKPLQSPDQLRIAARKIFERQSLINENMLLRTELDSGVPPPEIVFAGMPNVLKAVQDVAQTDTTVMLLGETGTGKTLISKIIHHLSGRKGLFVDINCAAIPETMLESEMFGHERGAFTGAVSMKKGRFELADEGTILLDEISEMSPGLQAKFLRVLQEKVFERLGSNNTLRTNARVIAATNRDLMQLAAEGRFREDLYYRLNIFPITLPPLRARAEHLEALSRHVAEKVSRRLGRQPGVVSAGSLKAMQSYPWPGNIRELENVIERAVIVSRGPELEISLAAPKSPAEEKGGASDLKALEKDAIADTLERLDGNRKAAALELGISLRSLQYKIKEYGLNPGLQKRRLKK
jgi:DNA-binding NtrC family response regulator